MPSSSSAAPLVSSVAGCVSYHNPESPAANLDKAAKDAEIQKKTAAKKRWREFRRKWIPAIKTILLSAADVVGDWSFFYRTKNTIGLDEYEYWIFGFNIVASVFGFLTILALFLKNTPAISEGNSGFRKKCLEIIVVLLAGEMFFEDIPQMILTTLVSLTKRGGEWTPVAVFNVTTSAVNFTFNILDILMPLEEEDISDDGDDDTKDV